MSFAVVASRLAEEVDGRSRAAQLFEWGTPRVLRDHLAVSLG
jgi:hypothetical protein